MTSAEIAAAIRAGSASAEELAENLPDQAWERWFSADRQITQRANADWGLALERNAAAKASARKDRRERDQLTRTAAANLYAESRSRMGTELAAAEASFKSTTDSIWDRAETESKAALLAALDDLAGSGKAA